jgi:hypothetical protein
LAVAVQHCLAVLLEMAGRVVLALEAQVGQGLLAQQILFVQAVVALGILQQAVMLLVLLLRAQAVLAVAVVVVALQVAVAVAVAS